MALTTGYEASGHTRYTTLEEEALFVAELAVLPRVHVEQIGTSTEGRPLWLVGVGGSGAPVLGGKPSFYINGCPHGDEPAGRESALMLMRDLALTSDSNLLAYLDTHDVWCIPSPNPDGRSRNGRDIAYGAKSVDLNRDTLDLVTAESQAIARVLRFGKVQIVADLHENWQATHQMMTAGAKTTEVDSEIRALNRIFNLAMLEKSAGRGYTSQDYGGAEEPSMLRNSAALRYALTIVAEGSSNETLKFRVDMLSGLLYDMIQWHRANAPILESTMKEARKRRRTEGGAPTREFDLEDVKVIPPTDYTLTWEQYGRFMRTAALLGIRINRPISTGGTATVHLGQDAQPLIPFLLDPASSRRAINDAPPALIGVMPEIWKYRIQGVLVPVERAGIVVNGVFAPVYTRKPTPEKYT